MKTIQQIILFVVCLAVTFQSIAGEAITYYHNDIVGSPVAATDTAGYIRWRAAYRPYGDRDQTVNQQLASADNAKWFTGHIHDEATGLTYAGARFYDPTLGRFISVDPADFSIENEQSFGRYTYANNNPYGYVDPDGEFAIVVVIAFVAAVAVTIAVADLIYKNPDQFNPARVIYNHWTETHQETLMYNGSGKSDSTSDGDDKSGGDEKGGVGLPDVLVGTQDKDARRQGNRHNSGPLDPAHGGTGDAAKDFDVLTGGKSGPAPAGSRYPPGTLVGENGISLRPGESGSRPRIDIPANGSKPTETLHY